VAASDPPIGGSAVLLPSLDEVLVKDAQGQVGQERRENAALGSAGVGLAVDARLTEQTRLEESLD